MPQFYDEANSEHNSGALFGLVNFNLNNHHFCICIFEPLKMPNGKTASIYFAFHMIEIDRVKKSNYKQAAISDSD